MESFPVDLAIEIVLKNTIYTNAMPAWFAPPQISSTAIEQRIQQYLANVPPESEPFAVMVPSRIDSSMRKWVVPSIGDQIVLQSSVSSIAASLDKVLGSNVYSYRLQTDPDRPSQFTRDRCSEYLDFKEACKRQASSCSHVLFIDIERAYASIQRDQFLEFLRAHTENSKDAIKVLDILLSHYSANDPGLPLMNDSLFFLGNAYFSAVDKIVGNTTKDFIRFVDDYCIFGTSESDLAAKVEKISEDLEGARFTLNDRKTRLMSSQGYLERCRVPKPTNTPEVGTPSITVARDVLDPSDLVQLVGHTINNPQQYLNDGFGRLQLMSLGKMRDTLPAWSREFDQGLESKGNTIQASLNLLDGYSKNSKEVWRSVWLLYMLKDISTNGLSKKPVAGNLAQMLGSISSSTSVPPVVRLWATQPRVDKLDDPSLLEKLYQTGYLQQGYLYHGRST
jgi:hypothetical protein